MTADVRSEGSPYWWVFLVTGCLWILFAMVVFRLDLDSVTAVGIAIGAVCIVAGINELFAFHVLQGAWKAFHLILGALFVLIGIVALVYPDRTFVEVAAIFSFFLALKGGFDVIAALLTRAEIDLWWLRLLVGIAELLLAFWAAGNFGREAVLLAVWIGAAALARGVTEIALAFALKAGGGIGPRPAY